MGNENIKVTSDQKKKIRDNSTQKLPLNPSQFGYSGSEIRSRFSRFVVGENDSVLALLEDKLDKIKTKFDALDEEDQEQAGEIIELVQRVEKNEEDLVEVFARIPTKQNVFTFETVDDMPNTGLVDKLYLVKKINVALEGEEDDFQPYNMLFAWDEEENEFVPVAGGGAAGGGGAAPTLIRLQPEPQDSPLQFSIATGSEVKVTVNFTHNEVEFGTLEILRGNQLQESFGVNTGIFDVDLTSYIRNGSNSITIRVSDAERTRSLTYNITGVAISLSSTFNDVPAQGSSVDIPFRVEAEAERKVYFTIDGVTTDEPITTTNNIKTLTGLTHGVKQIEIQAAAIVGEDEILSNILRFSLIVATESSPALIASNFNAEEMVRGSALALDYIVYNPLQEFNTVILRVNGEQVGQQTVGRQRNFWNLSGLPVGEHVLRIESAGVHREFNLEVTPLDVDFTNVEDSFLKLYLSASGKSNTDVGRESWNNQHGSPIGTSLQGFNFTSNGWIDEALVLNGNAQLTIPFKPFETQISALGKTIEFEFETTIGLDDEFIRCIHNGRGFEVFKDHAVLTSSNTRTETFFKENERIKISFVINPVDNTTVVYVNGVSSGIDRMNQSSNFQQSTPQDILINHKHVDGKLFNVRVYDRALTHHEILQNYLYDKTSIEQKVFQYNFSDIFDMSGNPDYNKVKERMPVMIVRTYEQDEFGNRMPNTADFRPWVSITYEHHQDPTRNFQIQNTRIRNQGTSTLVYPIKNYRLYSGDLDTNPFIPWEENQPAMVRINLKADYMESSLSNDPVLARLFDSMYNVPIPPRAIDGVSRTTIWTGGTLCLFHDNGQELQFWGVYNFNGDKGDLRHWGHYPENGFARSKRFEVNFNASDHAVAFVKKPGISEEEWLQELYDGFEPKPDEVYTPEMFAELKDFVEFISDADYDSPQGIEDFRQEFQERTELEYFLKYLVAIMVFGSVDQFGKDMLLNIWDDGTVEKPKWWIVMYDMDSVLGIDNQGFMRDAEGNLLYDYDIELEDAGVFAQAESKLWEGLFKCFPEEIKSTYAELRGGVFTFNNIWTNLIDYINTISKGMYNAHNIQRYIEAPGSEQWLWMLNGDRINQMNRWITNRLAFLDSKYDYQTDTQTIVSRFEITDASQIEIKVKTSLHQWVTGQLGNANAGFMKDRVQAGDTAILQNTYGAIGLPFVEFELFSGQYVTELVDWKNLPIRTLQVGQASQLQKLDLSKESQDSELQSISFGNNPELLEVDLRNNSGLGGVLDFSQAHRLQKLDLRGTNVTGVTLPNGGVLEELYLPNTITSLEIQNQAYLETVDLAEGTELETLILENTPIDYRDIFPYLQSDARVRVLGVEMSSFGDNILVEIQNDLDGKRGIDSFGVYIDNPFMQGIIRVQTETNVDTTLLNWFAVNLPDLYVEVNVVLETLVFSDEGDYLSITGWTDNHSSHLSLPTAAHSELSEENPIIFGIDGWKPVEKIGDFAFANKAFTSIDLPSTLKEIGEGAFNNSSGFQEVFIFDTVEVVKVNAFNNNHASLNILVEHDTKPSEWHEDWNSGESDVLWGVRSQNTLFVFDTKGGETLSSISARYLTSLPTPTKFGYNAQGWEIDGQEITLPYVPDKESPISQTIEVSSWTPWVYEVQYKLPDDSIHHTQFVTFGDSLGAEFVDIDKGGFNEPTFGSDIFRGWYTLSSGGTKLTNTYVINQDVLVDGYIVEYHAQFLDTQGLVFTYDSTDDVYDVTGFDLTDTSMPDGSINLLVPGLFDDGTNGEKAVRNVLLTCSNATQRNKVGILVIEGNGLTNRTMPNRVANHNYDFLTEVEIPEGFTSIGNSVFSACSSLTSITIPESVTSIGSSVFQNCSSLTSITIPQGVTSINNFVFRNCSSLTSITIPEGVTSIGSSAFFGCSLLTSITIPESVASISLSSFRGCSSLTSVTLERDNLLETMFSSGQFSTDADTTFYITSTQNAVKLTNNSKGVMNLDETTLLTYPGASGAFDFSAMISSNVTRISNSAFRDCSSLTSITIPESVTIIGSSVFQNCSSLTSITIPQGVTSIAMSTFENCSSLTSATIPEGVGSIGSSAFQNCSSLTSVTIPESVTGMGNSVFNGCSSLTSITIPQGLTSIPVSTFRNCSSLTSITIPEGVTSIGSSTFQDCSSLVSVNLLPTTPPSLVNTNAFLNNATGRTFYIPENTYPDYSTATNWATFASDMEEVI